MRHGEWHLVAVVTDDPADKNDRLVTTEEDVPYPGTTRDVRTRCDRCHPSDALRIIDYDKLRAALNAPRRGPVLKVDIDDVARPRGGPATP